MNLLRPTTGDIMGELLLANEGEDPNIITFHIPWGQCHISLLSQLFLPFFSRLGNWEFLPFFEASWILGGSRRNHIPHSGRVHCHVWRTQFPIRLSDQIIQKQTSMLQVVFDKHFKKISCHMFPCWNRLFSLHICIAACLTFQWCGCYTCFLPNWGRKHCFNMGWALTKLRQQWTSELKTCIQLKHKARLWKVQRPFFETWSWTGIVHSTHYPMRKALSVVSNLEDGTKSFLFWVFVISTQWEAFMVVWSM